MKPMERSVIDFRNGGAPGRSAAYWEVRDFGDGGVVFREGDVADFMGVVVEGRARIELDHGEVDSDAVLARVAQGEVVGELALLDGGVRSATVVAEGPLRLRVLTAAALERLAVEDPAAAVEVFRGLGAAAAAKVRMANERFAAVMFDALDGEVEARVAAARAVLPRLAAAEDAEVDALLERLAGEVFRHAEELAALTVAVTGMGDAMDKAEKNRFASVGVLGRMRGEAGTGVLGEERGGVLEIAAPAGVVFGLIPVTNPVATAVFKALICLKGRNVPILSFPRRAAEVGVRVDATFQQVLGAMGWPPATIQTVTHQNSRRRTEAFFRHAGVDLILATGGASMVGAAYRSGKPAFGVGQGNAPCLIATDADLAVAAAMIVRSKSFDHGLICGSEHNLVVAGAVREAFCEALEDAGAAVLDADEARRFSETILSADGSALRRKFIGQDAATLADAAEIRRERAILLLVVPTEVARIGSSHALAGEKMAPVLSLFDARSDDEALELSARLLEHEGRGHTAVIHTADRGFARRFALAMPASRILHNTPATQGVIGLTTGLTPSLTLGCGFFGGNSTTDNVTFSHLRNLKRLASHRTSAVSP